MEQMNNPPNTIQLTETDIDKLMWMMLAQYGVFIDNITDEGDVYFTVPDKSEFIVYTDAPLFGIELNSLPREEMMAGELLRQFVNSYFEDAGLTPHGGIREQYWTQILGQVRSYQEEQQIQKEGPQLLRI